MPDPDTQRKLIEILRILSESTEEMGARKIAEELNRRGYNLGERATRYHLRMLDERGFTKKHGYLGRVLTKMGEEELKHALVTDRMGFISTRIEDFEIRTTFDPVTNSGDVVVNICYVSKNDFDKAFGLMKRVVESGYAISPKIRVADEGEEILENDVPEGQVAFASVCSITIDGVLIKNGIPVNLKYGGIIKITDGVIQRFTDVIDYSGTSINPMSVFTSRKMTSIINVLDKGSGYMLANIREIPMTARDSALKLLDDLHAADINGIFSGCESVRPLLGVPIELGKCGIASYSGINPFAAFGEAGIKTRILPLAAVMNVRELKKME
ncbi:NrpR transcriptional repressor [Methanocella sp. CWC-04]|uniref:NrpR transcriptional repressor n=1 Tax=Methanooceanicella nereidis TaxID=2052831 RepID=A0AAP2RDH6_9EURY|nr:NrpR regulatory domain-containing protein [Methanocella sp. CWC-04]MCD1294242.1 NrpR transcriptional repressor [Methanocella sp. CWC-04]